MTKETHSKKKKCILKAVLVCMITAAGVLFFVYLKEINSSKAEDYKYSDENLNTVIAEDLGKEPNQLTQEDFENLDSTIVYGNELTDLNPLAKLRNLTKIIFYVADEENIDFTPLSRLENLKYIYIQKEQVVFSLSSRPKITFSSPNKKGKWYQKLLPFFSRFNKSEPATQYVDFTQFSQIKNLECLVIQNFELRNINALTSHKKLEFLAIGKYSGYSGNDKKPEPYDFTPIQNIPNLLSLDIKGSIVKDYDFIAGMPSLTSIMLSGTNIIDLTPFSGLSNMLSITLDHTDITDIKPLANLEKLHMLDISFTKVEDLKPLEKLHNLEYLYMRGTEISDEQVDELQKALPDLKIDKY